MEPRAAGWTLRKQRGMELLQTHREKVLYLFVGGWNTLFQYGVFALCWYLLSPHLPPVPILLVSYFIASVNGFLMFRYVVFKPVTHPLIEYLRFQLVYGPLLLINLIGFPLLIKHTTINPYLAQALFGVFGIVVAYIGNKYFTFRRSSRGASRAE